MRPSEFNFLDRYSLLEGSVILTGLQALVRIPIDQTRRDANEKIRLGTYVSGYQGSPLGTVDTHFKSAGSLLEKYRIHFQAGVNEDLAATAIYGTQLLEKVPHSQYDGVLGMWYGKGPGVDRTGDAFRHGVYMGTSKYGAVLVLAGDDPSCKSSTLPSDTTPGLYDLKMPILFPGNQQEILELGLKGVGLSRYTGLWTCLKIVTDTADSGSIVEVFPEQALHSIPAFEIDGKLFQKQQTLMLMPPAILETEREIFYNRIEAAKAYVYENKIDQIMVRSENDRIGLVSFGKSYYDLREALRLLGLDDDALKNAGIRLYKMGMIAPVEPRRLREFAEGLEEMLIVEEKTGFTEILIRNELYNQSKRPHIFGKKDRHGKTLFHAEGELKTSEILIALAGFLRDRVPAAGNELSARSAKMTEISSRKYEETIPRMPYFCSGCPHNSSTVNPDGEVGGGGIGCHAMATYMGRKLEFITHMGGEGANWIGLSHFTEKKHLFQNVGDGTYFHSANKAVEACVANGINITYKILYNSTVAMTGGQTSMGMLDPETLARKLECEGVKKIVIVAELPEKYPQKKISEKIRVVPKSQYEQSMLSLKKTKGVTVLIYDQECAAEKRRKRKRGLLEIPRKRILINEAVCEGCGDCGVKSNCLSVIPVLTEYGRKTQIHQSTCNFDYSCLKGDCPSFMTIELEEGAEKIKKAANLPKIEASELPEPEIKANSQNPYRIMMVGIGGTGVVTVSSILVAAAYLAGKYAFQMDQTGLAQKGGAVSANISIADHPFESAYRIANGQTDLLLAFDFLASVAKDNMDRLDQNRSIAIVNSHQINTAMTVTDITTPFPHLTFLQKQLNRHTRADQNIFLDANNISESLFANEQSNNIFMLGVAYQTGVIPVGAEYIEKAIRGNKVSVEQNINAFRWGRKYGLHPQKVLDLIFRDAQETISVKDYALAKLEKFESSQVNAMRLMIAELPENEPLKELLYPRVADLILFQNVKYAQCYLEFIHEIFKAETSKIDGDDAVLTETAARWLFKLMAYKDEYEVARLWVQDPAVEDAKNSYDGQVSVSIHLHPPLLRKWGMKQKLKLGSWVFPYLKKLAQLKMLRGTPLDLFAFAPVRQEELKLIEWYQDLIRQILPVLKSGNLQSALKIAALPDQIRGYEELKLENIVKTKKEAEQQLHAYLNADDRSVSSAAAKTVVHAND
ncbi:MAG: indolepyruvate ferredoxin oxidoreductase family protein [SAR324 cluster bacterium]|nr:indolepyruvate ferredoxin oxidoreductase family protein [SAR324 cluster bacterium]